MKKLLATLLTLALVAFGTLGLAETPQVGILQFAPHPSLDNCTEGFLQGLAEEGFVQEETVTVDLQNAMGDMATGDMQAKVMAARNAAMLVGVATPAAMSAYAAARDLNIPVVFVAVSDAVAAGIVESNEAPGGHATGVSDVLNLKAQVEMIRAFLPEAASIGVLYTTSEPNSLTHLAALQEIAEGYGFTVEAIGVTGPAEVAAAAVTLVSRGVDCINNFTDNNVVDNLALVLHAANEQGIPVFGSEVEQVVNGCLAAQGIDYVALGREAGRMAAKILRGEATPSETPVLLIDECAPAYNSEVAARLGLSLPAGYEQAVDVAAAP